MSLVSIRESLFPQLLKHEFGKKIIEKFLNHQAIEVHGMQGSASVLFAAVYFKRFDKSLLYICEDSETALYASTELEELLGKENVLYFPNSHHNPYDPDKVQNANIVLRTEVLSRISSESAAKIIVCTYDALSEKVLAKEDFKTIKQHICIGDKLCTNFIEDLKAKFHFNPTDFVSQPGEFSVRGGIIDVFSFSNEQPYRMVLFGNEVEKIKLFDVESQLTKASVQKMDLIANMNATQNQEKVSFFEFLPKDVVIFTKNKSLGLGVISKALQKAEENYSKLSKTIKHRSPNELYESAENFINHLQKFTQIDFNQQSKDGETHIFIEQTEQPAFHKNFELLAEDLVTKQKEGFSIWVSFSSEKQEERLQSIFKDIKKEIVFSPIKSELHEGFIDKEQKTVVYTDHQIFDRYQKYKSKNAFAKSEHLTLKDLLSLKVGDYISHIDHGIGKFVGLVKVNNNGKIQECFKLIYKNGDLLYVSIHTLHKITKYTGPEGKDVVLSKIGSPAWKNLKQKTKARVKQIAFDLIKLYAKRKTERGFAFAPDTYLQNELEASFMYEDTPDQEKTTLDVKKDMEAEGIMDRLVCGDVGFGKTEVGIRASFKAATDGKQVAVLVPTTILAFQHFRSFQERLKDFPVTINYINRFRSAKQKTEIKQALKNGKIDIIIGTHQLVGKDFQFKDLGLLIIDEEHKFGVSIKDKLKNLKANIDTLTLTATPIPRTLQFSLMAARDLSVMKTPPPNRQPINTNIIGFDEEQIRDAIIYELQRNGQVYFINNRIENLKDIAGLIQRLVPDARVITGHGQMEGKQLEQNILDFMSGKYDVLVSTTIVESGVDIPNANTIFVNDAHRFGMADLHQLRGRVGRSNRKAFCYLISPTFDSITNEARKRLEAVAQFSDLGSGFQIAMKDLEIRGAGDLLGGEQSGFINDMGFETYQKILQEALEELKNDETFETLFENEEDRNKLFPSKNEVSIDTDFELMLPDTFVQNTEVRLHLYQKLSEIEDKTALKLFENELQDRFGKLPEEAVHLLKSIELKWLGEMAGFEKIILKNDSFIGYFPSDTQHRFYQSEKFQKIIDFLIKNPHIASLKEKHSKEQSQLMMRKDGIKSVAEITHYLEYFVENIQ